MAWRDGLPPISLHSATAPPAFSTADAIALPICASVRLSVMQGIIAFDGNVATAHENKLQSALAIQHCMVYAASMNNENTDVIAQVADAFRKMDGFRHSYTVLAVMLSDIIAICAANHDDDAEIGRRVKLIVEDYGARTWDAVMSDEGGE